MRNQHGDDFTNLVGTSEHGVEFGRSEDVGQHHVPSPEPKVLHKSLGIRPATIRLLKVRSRKLHEHSRYNFRAEAAVREQGTWLGWLRLVMKVSPSVGRA